MIVMVANNTGGLVHYLAGKYPGKLGWLLSPATRWNEPREWLPYAVDNGKYSSWSNDEMWEEDPFYALLDRCKLCRFKPMWIAVPDAIGDKETTLWLWEQYELPLRKYGWPLAFVVQDGMESKDVPGSADLVFVGGTTTWKWRNVAKFAEKFRVHVGRVNWWDKLEYCDGIGAESVDGSGFFREGEGPRVNQLVDFISGRRRSDEQRRLFEVAA